MRVAHAKHQVGTGLPQFAELAVAHDGPDLLKRHLPGPLVLMARYVHDGHVLPLYVDSLEAL